MTWAGRAIVTKEPWGVPDEPSDAPGTEPDLDELAVDELAVDELGGDEFEDLDDLLDDEAFLEAWEAAERHAARVLTGGLADRPPEVPTDDELHAAARSLRRAHRAGDPAARWMLRAAGIDVDDDRDDAELVLRAVAATISMVEDPGLETGEAASIMTLELADWVGAILGLVRAGPGAAADPQALVDYGEEAEEVDAPVLDPDDRSVIEHGFLLVLPAWRAAGLVEGEADQARLTRIGAWALPMAAVLAWTGLDDLLDGALDLGEWSLPDEPDTS